MSNRSSRDQHAADSRDVFLSPYSDENPLYVHLHNMSNTNEKCMYDSSGRVLDAYNISGKPNARMLAAAQSKDTRMIAPTRGSTFIVGRQGKPTPEIADYVQYLLDNQLTTAGDLDKLLLTADFTDFHEILSVTAASGRNVVPYNPAPDFISLCRTYGIECYGSTSPEVGKLADKWAFREFAAQRYPHLFAYPRLRISNGDSATPETLKQLDAIIAYSAENQPQSDSDIPVLFVQKTIAAGGIGNYIVRQRPDGTFHSGQQAPYLKNSAAVASFVRSLESDATVSPFLQLVASPSFGMISGRSGITCLGPFMQILTQHNEYIGFRLNEGEALTPFDSEVAEFLQDHIPELLELCLQIGNIQHQHGYLGYSGVDTLIYRDGKGRLQFTLSELNLRYTATCMLQMMVHLDERLRTRFLDNGLSILQHDMVPLSRHAVAVSGGTTTGVAALLEKHAIPLLNSHTDHGVILMSRPVEEDNRLSIAVGVIATSDTDRDTLYERVVATLAAPGEG